MNEMDKLFDNKGEINAYDKADCIRQIAKFAQLLNAPTQASTAPATAIIPRPQYQSALFLSK